MLRVSAWIFVCSIAFFVGAEGLPAVSPPFWKAKQRFYSRIKDGEIIVSVQKVTPAVSSSFKNSLKILGGGWIKAPRDFVFAFARKFDQIAMLSGFVEKATYHSENATLDLVLSVFGHRADLVIGINAHEETDPKQIEFSLLKGPLKGLRSQVSFASVEGKTEVGMDGIYSYDEFPIPRLFLEFGLEVMFQKMAARLRTKAEAAYHSQALPK